MGTNKPIPVSEETHIALNAAIAYCRDRATYYANMHSENELDLDRAIRYAREASYLDCLTWIQGNFCLDSTIHSGKVE